MRAAEPYTVVFNSANSVWLLQGVIGSGTQYLTSNFSVSNSTSLTNVTGFAFGLLNGQTYAVEVQAFIQGMGPPANSGFKDALACTCTASNVLVGSEMFDGNTFQVEGSTASSFGTAMINEFTATGGIMQAADNAALSVTMPLGVRIAPLIDQSGTCACEFELLATAIATISDAQSDLTASLL
jgi:hypothetical protein